MRKISQKNQAILKEANKYGLDLNLIRAIYGLPFAIRVFRYAKRKSKDKIIYSIYPTKFYSEKKSIYDYIDELEDAGFKLKKVVEDFIDEDTGEVVPIKRFYFKPLKKMRERI